MPIVTIPEEALPPTGQKASTAAAELWCRRLEEGNILFFPQSPIPLPPEDIEFLRTLEQTSSGLHKNLAYKPSIDRVSGADMKNADPAAGERLHHILRQYSQAVTAFLSGFLSPYRAQWQLDYGSYRPQEEQGRDLPLRRRNDLMHTDAFPTRPTHGARILRFFNNLHPTRTRDWITGEPFGALIPQFAPGKIPLPRSRSGPERAATELARAVGLHRAFPALKRSPYDQFMMRFHNLLKEDSAYQANGFREASYFPPGSSWMVYTDMVPHAVLAGQYALEQTFLVEPAAMVAPEHSPLKALERLSGQSLL
jgi:hypothetical protein